MGGLARTCEIFNASKLILHDVAVTRTAEFQGISMAAEHWLPIEAVPIARIDEWLQVWPIFSSKFIIIQASIGHVVTRNGAQAT
jgi:hypothetical protein